MRLELTVGGERKMADARVIVGQRGTFTGRSPLPRVRANK